MSSIIIKEVTNKKLLKQFIFLPEKIHEKHMNWVPPIYMDEWDFFNKDKNPNFKKNETIMFIAFKGEKAVGRIMGIIPKVYNFFHKENNARFAFLETYDDIDVTQKLINAVKEWALTFNVEKLIGPLSFSDKEPQGFLYEGYDKPHVIASNCNLRYQTKHLVDLGFNNYKDLFVYNFSLNNDLPPLYYKLAERNLKHGYKIVEFSNKLKARKYIHPILNLVNKTYKDIYASTPFSDDEMDDFANKYLAVIHPKLIKIILDKNDNLVAFVIAMRDIGKGLRLAKGKLFPIGFVPFLYHQSKTKQMNLLLGAIANDHRNRGLDALLGVSLFKSAKELGLEEVDSHLVLEENVIMRKELERINGKVYKKYRLYSIDL
ncbi:MAG: hypothetical protein ABFR62_02455 [Bacteroidota bacterium]